MMVRCSKGSFSTGKWLFAKQGKQQLSLFGEQA